MKIQVLRNVFERNDRAATENRALFDENRVTCVNILGGAGSGKTAILEVLLPRFRGPSASSNSDPQMTGNALRIAVLEGDLATTRDAERISAIGLPVVQLLTDGGCHLNATLVQHGLECLRLPDLDLLVIENVGNPICPANFDLGEHFRISVLSVAEGDDKPAKYPLLFKDAALVLLTKCDLLPYVDFDPTAAIRRIRRVNPRVEIIETSARTGTGLDQVAAWLVGPCASAAVDRNLR